MTESNEDNIQLNENDTNMEFATPEKQEARAFLRERFLRVITGIVGRKLCFFKPIYFFIKHLLKIFSYSIFL